MAAAPAPVEAALQQHPTQTDTLTITAAAQGRCATGIVSGPSVVSATFTAPATGTVTAQLSGSANTDFDVAIIRAGAVRSGSAAFGSTESASTFVTVGEPITVQVCRRKGPATTVTRRVFFTSNDGPGRIAVGARIPGVALEARPQPTARAAGAAAGRALPSARTSYRTLAEFEEELKGLTELAPGLVRPITLELPTWDGRQIVGVEIAENVHSRDGRPTYVQIGAHHANEWPGAEAPMEFGLELVKNYLRDDKYLMDRPFDPRLHRIVREARTLVIPVLNPDGFDVSRQSELYGGGLPQKRKNCRPTGGGPYFQCLARATVAGDLGVDPNRNWGLEWGGPGTSSNTSSGNYSGPGPFSEPETEGIRRLLRDRQAAVLVTNHTSGRVLMRPPGTTRNGPTPDEGLMKPIGDAMGAAAAYTSQYSYNLYNTTGSTSDYTYRGLGVFPYTPEIGSGASHPPYTTGFIPEYDTRGQGGLREAYTIAGLAAIDPEQHSIITGFAPAGRVLRIRKQIRYITSDRPNDNGFQWPVQTITENRQSTMVVGTAGAFTWHVSPSQQPLRSERTPWVLTCESASTGQVFEAREVDVARSQVADLGPFCGSFRGGPVPPPQPPAPPGPETPPPDDAAAIAPQGRPQACPPGDPAFRFVGARPRGRSVLLRFSRLVPEEVSIRITQLTRGTRKLDDPEIVRRLFRERSFVWSGRNSKGRRVGDGLYVVTFSMAGEDDVRRLTLRKRNGRFTVVGAPTAVNDCG